MPPVARIGAGQGEKLYRDAEFEGAQPVIGKRTDQGGVSGRNLGHFGRIRPKLVNIASIAGFAEMAILDQHHIPEV